MVLRVTAVKWQAEPEAVTASGSGTRSQAATGSASLTRSLSDSDCGNFDLLLLLPLVFKFASADNRRQY